MVGTYSGTDCQGSHTNGNFSMVKGVASSVQPTPTLPAPVSKSAEPIVQYGSASELKGVRKIFIYGVEPDVRINMVKQFAKHPTLELVGDLTQAEVVLIFGANTFSWGGQTHVWTDGNGNAWSTTSPYTGVAGQGSAIKFVPPNTLRVIWQFSTTRTMVFQRRPSTNFVRDFVSAWEKANE